jgi:hypothetical protein
MGKHRIKRTTVAECLGCTISTTQIRLNYGATRNCLLLFSVPLGVATTTVPVEAPGGTTALMYVSDATLKFVAATALKVTPVVPG